MANIGLRSFLFAPLGENEKYTSPPQKLAGAISYDENIETDEAELFYDDALGEYDYSFVSGTITLGIDEDNEAILAPLYGNTVTETTFQEEQVMVVHDNQADEPKPVGFGLIQRKKVNNQYKYRVTFYKKVTFSPINASGQTKSRNMEFNTPTVEGKITTLSDGSWRTRATFANAENAVAFLESLFENGAQQ